LAGRLVADKRFSPVAFPYSLRMMDGTHKPQSHRCNGDVEPAAKDRKGSQ
jgi:hypothetical protein